MTITEFILARIAEDEAAVYEWDSDATEKIATMWTGGNPGYTTVASGWPWPDEVWFADGSEVKDPRHVRVLYDPARVLAQCEAMRRIVELHVCAPEVGEAWDPMCSVDAMGHIPEPDACEELHAIAAIWSDHPDYDAAWRP